MSNPIIVTSDKTKREYSVQINGNNIEIRDDNNIDYMMELIPTEDRHNGLKQGGRKTIKHSRKLRKLYKKVKTMRHRK